MGGVRPALYFGSGDPRPAAPVLPGALTLRPHRVRPRAERVAQLGLDLVRPAAEQRAGAARVDQLVHAELLGAREHRLRREHLVLELAAPRLGVGRALDLLLEGELHPALD